MFQFYHLGKCKFPFDRLKNRKKMTENLSIIACGMKSMELSLLLVYFFMMFRMIQKEENHKIGGAEFIWKSFGELLENLSALPEKFIFLNL